MVVFSCDGCGEMLKKQQVDSHAARCRRCDSVCCLDCNVSFYGGKKDFEHKKTIDTLGWITLTVSIGDNHHHGSYKSF